MPCSVVRFEMRLQVTQGINSRAAAFTDRSPLCGRAHRHLFEHGGDKHFHVLFLQVVCCSMEGAMGVPMGRKRRLDQKTTGNQEVNRRRVGRGGQRRRLRLCRIGQVWTELRLAFLSIAINCFRSCSRALRARLLLSVKNAFCYKLHSSEDDHGSDRQSY